MVRIAALVLAVAAAVVLVVITLRQPKHAAPAPAPAASANEPVQLATAWPGAVVTDASSRLADGTAYSPLAYLDANTSVGTATTPDGVAERLVLRSGTGEPRELHRLPADHNPQWFGFAASGDDLVWVESTSTVDKGENRLWRANVRTPGPAVGLTADTGDIVLFNSQYDLLIVGGAVRWTAAARGSTPVTELRSIPLSGGTVSVKQVPGAYAMSAWPWLVSVANGQPGPVDLLNVDTGAKVKVPATAIELLSCSPTWCRIMIMNGTGEPARIDMMHVDGSERRRIAGGDVEPATTDVGLLDRFEVLAKSTSDDESPTSSQQVILYDTTARRLVLVGTGAGTVAGRDNLVWWSTGEDENTVWHVLDLSTLK